MNSPRFTSWLAATRQRLTTLLRDHTTLSLTVFYIFLTVIGACHEFFLYARFHVNILQFADPLDFLLAAIRQPLVVVFCLLPLALLWLFEVSDQVIRAWLPWYGRTVPSGGFASAPSLERWLYPIFIVIYFTFFTLKLSQYSADRLSQGHGRRVAIRLSSAGAGEPDLQGILLGTTARYVFVFQPADSSTHVVPVGSMAEMRMLRRRSRQ